MMFLVIEHVRSILYFQLKSNYLNNFLVLIHKKVV